MTRLIYRKIPLTYQGLTITVADNEEGYYARITWASPDGQLHVMTAGPRTTRDAAVDLVIARTAIAITITNEEMQP